LIEKIDDWANTTGEWFASGAIGSGMVCYQGKYFIAEVTNGINE
jgi:hypothetical protein